MLVLVVLVEVAPGLESPELPRPIHLEMPKDGSETICRGGGEDEDGAAGGVTGTGVVTVFGTLTGTATSLVIQRDIQEEEEALELFPGAADAEDTTERGVVGEEEVV